MILYNGDIFEFVLWDIVEKMRYILKHPYRFDNENEFRALLNLTDNNNIYNALAAYDSVYLSLR